ncbi:MAG: PH domain-containing protein [Deltaproteobacteria bacterium]|nr:PH domain-containing protein [Deltaproteobacteria bacterium]
MKQVYESKRDGWLVVMLWVAAIIMLVAAGNIWVARAPFIFRLLIAVLLILMTVFVLWVLYGTRYTLSDTTLLVQSGPFRWVIDLVAITEVFPTRNPLSSPACSLDRLHIRYHSSPLGLMISPRDKVKFLLDLVARSPGLKMEGDKVVRDTRAMTAADYSAHAAKPTTEITEK